MSKRPRFTLIDADPQALQDEWILTAELHPDATLGDFLRKHPALCLTELTEAHLQLPVGRVSLDTATVTPGVPLYLAPGIALPSARPAVGADDGTSRPGGDTEAADASAAGPASEDAVITSGHPVRLSEKEAVLRAYAADIKHAATYLANGLSVLVSCEKLLVEHLAAEVATRSNLPKHMVRVAPEGPDSLGMPMGGGRRAALLAELQVQLQKAPDGDVIVVPHLDLLAGGSDAALSAEAREVTDLLYDRSGSVLLGFVDPSMVVPEVLANRFAVRLSIEILPREVRGAGVLAVPIGQALVTQDEADLFAPFEPTEFYKHVAGMNAVRLRHALRFAAQKYRRPPTSDRDPAPADDDLADDEKRVEPSFTALVHELAVFKARTSTASFDVPNVPFEAIGGYENVKAELIRALDIVSGSVELPEDLRHDLVPRGFVLHGPPGTGKTLFAKAIATRLKGTIQVVSGPEITDKYVGESERKIRDLFAEARRNAPAVLVFDEFDSIAGQRSGRDDGGSRAGNAIVAQLLTELDGFRPEVPVIIIGTTNRIDLIDVALLRPSRFRPIKIDLPNPLARLEIARWHAKRFGVEVSAETLQSLCLATEGLNGDELRSVFRDARADQLVGARKGQPIGPGRIGELVGQLMRARQQQDVDRARATQGASPAYSAEAQAFHLIAGSDGEDEEGDEVA